MCSDKGLHSTVQYSTVQYSTVQYSTVQFSTVQYSAVLYSTVQYLMCSEEGYMILLRWSLAQGALSLLLITLQYSVMY